MNRQRLWGFLVLAGLLIWRDPLPLPFSAVPPSSSVRAVQSVPSPALGRRQYGAPVGSPIDGGLSDQSQIDVPLDPEVPSETDRYRPITILNIAEVAEKHHRLAPCLDDIRLSSLVFPFKASPYVVEELIDWEREGSITDDPFYRLIFPTMAMLSSEHQARLREVQEEPLELKAVVAQIRRELNPHPAGQKELNAPKEDGLTGIQHKYDSTVLFSQQLHKLAMPIAHTASAGHNLLGIRTWSLHRAMLKVFSPIWKSIRKSLTFSSLVAIRWLWRPDFFASTLSPLRIRSSCPRSRTFASALVPCHSGRNASSQMMMQMRSYHSWARFAKLVDGTSPSWRIWVIGESFKL